MHQFFLAQSPKANETKTKINKWDLIKLKNLLHSKGNHQQNKKTTCGLRENICKWCNWQAVNLQNIQTTHKTQRQKDKQPSQKMDEIDISPKETYRWLTGTWKDAQYHWLLEKYKSKPRWGITSHWSEWPPSKKSTNNKCWRWHGEKGTLLHWWWECNWCNHYRKQYAGSLN